MDDKEVNGTAKSKQQRDWKNFLILRQKAALHDQRKDIVSANCLCSPRLVHASGPIAAGPGVAAVDRRRPIYEMEAKMQGDHS